MLGPGGKGRPGTMRLCRDHETESDTMEERGERTDPGPSFSFPSPYKISGGFHFKFILLEKYYRHVKYLYEI